MRKQTGWIYQLVFPNGKSYVGQTIHWARRMREHARGGKSEDGHVVKQAIRKYGWANVKVVVLMGGPVPRQEMDAWEMIGIREQGSLSPDGYNLTEGGDAQPMDHPEVRAWHKQRIGEAMRTPAVRAKKRALWKDSKHRAMMHEARTGSDVWMQARKDCQNTVECNEKRRAAWARKRAVKVAAMSIAKGREFMRCAKRGAMTSARKAALRVPDHYGRDPVAEVEEFWDKEIAQYEATVWCVP